MTYYERIWGGTLKGKAPATITPEMCLARQFSVACTMAKVDRRKVSKFINRHGGPAPKRLTMRDHTWSRYSVACSMEKVDRRKVSKFIEWYVKTPECVDDILEFPTPRNTHYPIHWNRDLTMELFSSHMCGYEGDWFAQKRYY